MWRAKYSLHWWKKYNSNLNTDLFNSVLPERRLILFLVGNLCFLYVLLQPGCGTLPILPSTDQTCVVHPLKPLEGKLNSHFFCWGKLLKDSLHIRVETRLMTSELDQAQRQPPRPPKTHPHYWHFTYVETQQKHCVPTSCYRLFHHFLIILLPPSLPPSLPPFRGDYLGNLSSCCILTVSNS